MTPMQLNDEQLLPFGFDPTVSVSKSCPSDLQKNSTEQIDVVQGGCIVRKKFNTTTTYVIKNNASKAVDTLYIDHSADSRYRGFVITTTKNCIKSVMGFSRYKFSLNPQQTVEFAVEEEAFEDLILHETKQLEKLLSDQIPELLEKKIVTKQTVEAVQRLVKQKDVQDALQAMVTGDLSQQVVHHWLDTLVKEGLIPKSLGERAGEIVTQDLKIEDCQGQIRQLNDKVSGIFKNQERLRENIKSLEKMPENELVKRYLRDLNKEEDDLIKTRGIIETLETQRNGMQKILRDQKNSLANEAQSLLKTQ
jgi:hypothetical protein